MRLEAYLGRKNDGSKVKVLIASQKTNKSLRVYMCIYVDVCDYICMYKCMYV